jgi:hypothetical protein
LFVLRKEDSREHEQLEIFQAAAQFGQCANNTGTSRPSVWEVHRRDLGVTEDPNAVVFASHTIMIPPVHVNGI